MRDKNDRRIRLRLNGATIIHVSDGRSQDLTIETEAFFTSTKAMPNFSFR